MDRVGHRHTNTHTPLLGSVASECLPFVSKDELLLGVLFHPISPREGRRSNKIKTVIGLEPFFRRLKNTPLSSYDISKRTSRCFWMLLGFIVGLKHEQTKSDTISINFHTTVWQISPKLPSFRIGSRVMDFGWPLEELERLRAEDPDGGGGHEIAVFFVELECLSQDAKRPCQTMKYIMKNGLDVLYYVFGFRMFSYCDCYGHDVLWMHYDALLTCHSNSTTKVQLWGWSQRFFMHLICIAVLDGNNRISVRCASIPTFPSNERSWIFEPETFFRDPQQQTPAIFQHFTVLWE